MASTRTTLPRTEEGLTLLERQVTVELREGLPIQILVSATAAYGSHDRRLTVSIPSYAVTEEQLDQLHALLTAITEQAQSRLAERLRYDVNIAMLAAIRTGEEPGPEV